VTYKSEGGKEEKYSIMKKEISGFEKEI